MADPTTLVTLISDALREIRVLSLGDTAEADQIEDGKRTFQNMLGFWSIDGLKIPYLAIETFNLDTTQGAYTWGASEDFDSAAPLSPNDIAAVSWIFGTRSKPLRPFSVQGLMQVPYLGNTQEPRSYFYQLGDPPTLRLDCIPLGGALKIASRKPLDDDIELTDTLTFPPSYILPLRFNLAIFLAAGYGKEISPTLSAVARTTKRAIERVNAQPIPNMVLDIPGAGPNAAVDYAPIVSPWN